MSEDVHKCQLFVIYPTLRTSYIGNAGTIVIDLFLLLGPLSCHHFSHAGGDIL